MKLNNHYAINKAYKFKNDVKRVILTNNKSGLYSRIGNGNIYDKISIIIHPLIVYLFSFFNGKYSLEKTIEMLSSQFGISKDYLLSLISPLIYNTENHNFQLIKDVSVILPRNFLVESSNYIDLLEGINIELMIEDMDLVSVRNYIPDSISIMINNKCITDCIYCYADINKKQPRNLDVKIIEDIITQINGLGGNDISITGGDLFMHPNWFEIISLLKESNYEPYISTKFPVDEIMIKKLKELNIELIQISLDSINCEESLLILGVNNAYVKAMKNSISLLEKGKMCFNVKVVLTKHNGNITSLKKLIDYLMKFEYLKEIVISDCYKSFYKLNDYILKDSDFTIIEIFLTNAMLNNKKIKFEHNRRMNNLYISDSDKLMNYTYRKGCPGNVKSLNILPDGLVTICEQMYWHDYFILGNVKNNSIIEIWNSEKALALWNLSQNQINMESPCRICKVFYDCRRGKGVCWSEVIKEYGYSKFDFPYPGCPHS